MEAFALAAPTGLAALPSGSEISVPQIAHVPGIVAYTLSDQPTTFPAPRKAVYTSVGLNGKLLFSPAAWVAGGRCPPTATPMSNPLNMSGPVRLRLGRGMEGQSVMVTAGASVTLVHAGEGEH